LGRKTNSLPVFASYQLLCILSLLWCRYFLIKALAALLILLKPYFAMAQADTTVADTLHAVDEVVVTGIVTNNRWWRVRLGAENL
jgi:hypothetical protein